jgi:hypothetical protein
MRREMKHLAMMFLRQRRCPQEVRFLTPRKSQSKIIRHNKMIYVVCRHPLKMMMKTVPPAAQRAKAWYQRGVRTQGEST